MIIFSGEKSIQLQLVEEIEILNGKIEIQEKNKNICSVYMEKISDYINHINPSSIQNQSQFENTLMSLKNICDNVIINLQDLNSLKESLYNLDKIPKENLKNSIDKYNEAYIKIIQKIDRHDAQMQDFTTSALQNYAFMLSINDSQLIEDAPIIKHSKIIANTLDNNILIISEKDQVAYLPYRQSDIGKYLSSKRRNKHKYYSVQEIIDNIYTVPLSLYKFPTIARFREVFNLVRKEDSLLEAFETAVELMTNFNLNPIIVRACRNVQELDIFVDCLEEEETDKFPCFEIKYEIAPMVQKRRNQL